MRSWFFAILRDYQYFHLTATNTSTNITHTVIIAYFTVLIIGCHLWIVWQKNLSFSSLVLVIAPPQDVVIILFPLKDNEDGSKCAIFPFIGTS
jgi:hypothetical protein